MDPFILPPWISVASVVGASAAGAITFAVIRPHKDSVLLGLGTIAVGTLMGGFLSFGFCAWLKWQSIHEHNIMGFFVGLLGVIFCRAIVTAAESQAANIVMSGIRRLLGVKDEPPTTEEK